MKKSALILLSLLLALSLASCNSEQVASGDGQTVAGYQAGNRAVDYSFAYPDEWNIVRNDGTIELQLDCNASEGYADYAAISVLAFTLPDEKSDYTASRYWEEQETETASVFNEYKFLDKKEYSDPENYLDDSPAVKVKYSGKMNGRAYISEQIICCRYGEVFLITLVAPELYYEDSSLALSSALAQIKESFKFESRSFL